MSIFVVQISKGRTVRALVGFVLFIPTIINFVWFSVFGGTGLYIEQHGGEMVASRSNPNPPVANRIFWRISEGTAAVVLLMTEGLLQAASASAGLPQSLLLLLGCIGLVKVLQTESV